MLFVAVKKYAPGACTSHDQPWKPLDFSSLVLSEAHSPTPRKTQNSTRFTVIPGWLRPAPQLAAVREERSVRHVAPPLLAPQVLVRRLSLAQEVGVEAEKSPYEHGYHRRPKPQQGAHQPAPSVQTRDENISRRREGGGWIHTMEYSCDEHTTQMYCRVNLQQASNSTPTDGLNTWLLDIIYHGL